jgi:hypothetical protein
MASKVPTRLPSRSMVTRQREVELLQEAIALVTTAWERVHEADVVRARAGAAPTASRDQFADRVATLAASAADLEAELRTEPDADTPLRRAG